MSLAPTRSSWTRENNLDSSRVFITESSGATEIPPAPTPRKTCFEKFQSLAVNNLRIVIIVISYIVLITIIVILFYYVVSLNSQKNEIQRLYDICPTPWIKTEGHCYKFSTEEKNWNESQKYCTSHNAALAKITKEEMAFVMNFISKKVFWIGLKKKPDQSWKWLDGKNATLKVLGNGSECAFLTEDGTANSGSCSTEHYYICKKNES